MEQDKEMSVALTPDLLPLRLIKFPNDLLVGRNMDVKSIDENVQAKVSRLFEIMYETGNGVGLAAPQAGWNVKIFVLNLDKEKKKSGEMVFINPRLVDTNGDELLMDEGCLSFPGVYAKIRRWTQATVVAQGVDGKSRDVTYEGLGAQALQHEMDHLEGILFIEKMTPADKKVNEPRIKELVANYWRRNKK
jgi:peptide deformylase